VIVLGINAYGHDAACVLLRDGDALFAASEERFDRRRHSGAFPWTRSMGRVPKLLHVLRHLPGSLAFLREQPDDTLPDRIDYLRRMRGLEREPQSRGLAGTVNARRVDERLVSRAAGS
jgi:hypothetical protein